jgi:hypothetical protein
MNSEQLRFFKTFGYILLPQHLNADALAQLARDHEDALTAQYPAERNDGSERLWTRMTDESTPFAAALMEDPRFLGPAQQICGDDVLGIGVDINRYVSTTTWHASHGGSDNRRAWNLDYFANPQSPEEIESIRALGLGHAGSIKDFKTRRQYNYSRNWLDNPQQSPIRQRWIDRFEKIDYLDQPGVGEPARA